MSVAATAKILSTPSEDDPFFFGYRDVERRDANGNKVWVQVPLTEDDVLHPIEGDHIEQNGLHEDNRGYLKDVFRWRLHDRPDVTVFSDCGIDFQCGFRPLCPDVFVVTAPVRGNPHKALFPVKDERALIQLAVELTSPSTRDKDLDDKVELYAAGGVPFYVIVDNRIKKDVVHTSILAYEMNPDRITRIPLTRPGRVRLPFVDLILTHEQGRLVCLLPDGTAIPDYETMMRRMAGTGATVDSLRAEKDREKARADTLALELAELKAKISPP